VLLVLVIAVGVLSLGSCNPFAVVEPIQGISYTRPPAASVAAATPHEDVALESRLDKAAVVSRGLVGIYVQALDGGAVAATNADRSFPAASLFKLPIMVEVLTQQELHRLDPDEPLEIRPEDWTDGSGVLQARVGDRLPVRELLRLMIQESDNIAALVLLNAVGADDVNATLDKLGMSGTRVVDRRTGEEGDNVTTARDMGTLMAAIGSGQLIDADVSEAALKLLEAKQSESWLTDGLPWWVKVAHKWGDLPGARNDAGVVFTPRGNYVAVVLTEDAPPDEAAQAIARTSAAAYDYLGSADYLGSSPRATP
jgi:beta-lactamase class A